jgi:hypothetical protein
LETSLWPPESGLSRDTVSDARAARDSGGRTQIATASRKHGKNSRKGELLHGHDRSLVLTADVL